MNIEHINKTAYQLAKSENLNIFHQIEEELFLSEIKSQESPYFIIVGGQPGCGKSIRCNILHNQYKHIEDGEALIVGMDRLRHYHPKYDFLHEQNDKLSALYTGEDAGIWTEMLIRKAAERRCNVVYESTLKNPDVILFIIKELKEKAGYDISLQLLIVKPEISQVSTYLRYELMKERQGYGRYVIPQYHNDSFNNIPKTLHVIKKQGLVSKIELYTRDKPLFQEDYKKNDIVAMANTEYQRPLTPEEIKYIRKSWRDVRHLMLKRSCHADDLKEIDELSRL